MSAELRHLRERCDAFDALADALGTPDSRLSYRVEALRDQLQECERQDAARPSTLERICTALIDRDEALQQARGDVERMRTLASTWEAEVVTVRAADQELRSWLQEAQAQQGQADERVRAAEQRAKEADELKATLDAKVAALAIAEDQLLQERTARQGAEGQLQQERTALADVRSALERERTTREAAQKSLEERNIEFSKLEGELVVLSITSASQEQSLKEQSDTVIGLGQVVEAERRALEAERKQVEGRSLFVSCFTDFPLEGSSPLLISSLLGNVQACTPRWGTRPIGPRRCRPHTTPPSGSCWSCVLRPSRPARPWRRARRRPEARWLDACAPSAGTSPGACAGLCTLVSRRLSEWCDLITRSTSKPWRRATSSPRASRTRWRWSAWTR
jgi:hypothetical protein